MSDMIEKVIPAEQVPTDPVRCPKCGQRNLTLKGNITRAFEERLQDGHKIEQKVAEALERETSVIECHDCQIRFLIMTPEEYELQCQNMTLHESLLELSPNYIRSANTLPC